MNVERILNAFSHTSALIVGDVCLDRWCTYDPAASDVSRETGIPRIGVVSTEVTPGAGGTVANNLAALGIGRVAMIGAVGDDGSGYELKRALKVRGISTDLLVTSAALPTFTYTKLLNKQTGDEDRPRVDFIFAEPLPASVETQVIARLRNSVGDFDLILVSDQAETSQGGVITGAVRNFLSELAASHPEKLIWVDSRMRSHLFRKAILKPNEQEFAAASIEALGRVDYEGFRRHLDTRLLFVTQGSRGVMVVDSQGEQLVPTRAVEKPVDICGAGDSFSAAASVALAATGSAMDAAQFGNLVASITIMKKGTGTASPEEVRKISRTAGALV
ncbi:MAG: PfkB family carbohydrate kinase [Bryobacteraceae bacterium]|jgi:rfaE bifunctional protein kinase chain/domain